MRADLHIHTTASDGSWPVEKLISELKRTGIGLFSVTDHDSVAGIAAAGALAAREGLRFIPGVEISTTLCGQSFHILGYGMNPAAAELSRILSHNTKLMEEVDHTSIKKLIADGFAIDYNEFCAYQHNPLRGGWKSLSFLIDKGFCTGVADFFANLFTAERGIFFPEFPAPATVMEAIAKAGGVPVLAHPGSDFHGPALEETLDFFAREDIAGIECFHPGHDAATTKRAVQWCLRHDLLITGGSDCHGAFVPQRYLGMPEVNLQQLKLGRLLETW